MRPSRTRIGAAVLAAVPVAAILLTSLSPAAQADVDSVTGTAFAASLSSSLLGQVIAPTPLVTGTATEPTNSFGPIVQSSLPVSVPGLLSIGVLNAETAGDGVAAGEPAGHLGFARSRASAADVIVGLGSLSIDAVESVCRSDGNGSTGSTELVGAVLGGNPLVQTPLPNTTVEIPGILSVVLNEQIRSDAVGSTSITVRALHVTVLPGLGSLLGLVDVVVAESRCAATGPDVNSTTSSSTSSSTSTTPPTVPQTTAPPTTAPPTTAPPTTAPPTTVAQTVPPTVPPAGSTTAGPTTTAKVPAPAAPLARTGSDPMPMLTLAVAAILLGLVAYRSSGVSPSAWGSRAAPAARAAYRPVGVLPSTARRWYGAGPIDPAVADALDALEGDDTGDTP